MKSREGNTAPGRFTGRFAGRLGGKRALGIVVAALLVGAVAVVLWLQLTAAPPPRPAAAAARIPPVAAVALPARPASPPAPPAPAVAAKAGTPPGPAPAPVPAAPGVGGGAIALVPAPDPDLVAKSPDGPLPIVAPDGRQAWQAYARPFDMTDKRPRIAIVITGLGLSETTTETAIRELPPAVTLSFMPYYEIAPDLQQARGAGHETLLDLPMEPLDYPRQDPGPRALLTGLSASDNLDRLHWMMSRGTGYIGMMTYMGSRFLAAPDLLRPILADLKGRGLAFVVTHLASDDTAVKLAGELKLPHAVADRIIDAEMSRAGIERELGSLEELARRGGSAVGVGRAYPVTISAVAQWAAHLPDRGIALAPLSAVLAQ